MIPLKDTSSSRLHPLTLFDHGLIYSDLLQFLAAFIVKQEVFDQSVQTKGHFLP